MTTVGFTRTRPGGVATPPPPPAATTERTSSIWQGILDFFNPTKPIPGTHIGGLGKSDLPGVPPVSQAANDLTFGVFGSVDQAITSTTDFLKLAGWILHPINWLRMVEFVTGISMIYFGLRNTFKGRGGGAGRFYAERQRTARTRERSKQATEKTRHETERTRRARESTKRAREKTKQEFERTRRKENRGRRNR